MADLSFRFDAITEEHYDRQLAELRDFARDHTLSADVGVEIGSNKGRFIHHLAQREPDRTLIGIEIRKKYAEMADARLRKDGLDAAHVLRADAELAIPILLDDGQLGDLWILYPDPWWKARHRKRRVVRTQTLDLYAAKMRPGGRLWVRTDVGPLANDMRADLNAHPDFEPMPLEDYPMTPFPYSERDVRSINMGMPVQLLYYVRR
jgi:tRNA (guanine-N7-)-methyltransferase